MYGSERRRRITESLAASGRVTVAELSEELEVSAETVRRDMSAL